MQTSKEELKAALRGKLTEHHKFMLTTIKEAITDKETLIEKIDKRIEEHLKENELDAKLLQTIPGVNKDAAAGILAEIRNDMERSPYEQHLVSWAGISPRNNESAGKKSSRTTHGDIFLKI